VSVCVGFLWIGGGKVVFILGKLSNYKCLGLEAKLSEL
jgi:hypothetical protein